MLLVWRLVTMPAVALRAIVSLARDVCSGAVKQHRGSADQLHSLVQGVKYNIPVVIWLTDKYPQSAPLIYVTPTPNMVIKQNHSFLDPSGMVHTPCITNWLYPRSNLLDTVTEMSIIFGSETPLYSKPANYTGPAPMYQAAQPASAYPMVNPMHPMHNTSPPGAAGGSNYYVTTASPPPPPMHPAGEALHWGRITWCAKLTHQAAVCNSYICPSPRLAAHGCLLVTT
jgi:hypothetical protein